MKPIRTLLLASVFICALTSVRALAQPGLTGSGSAGSGSALVVATGSGSSAAPSANATPAIAGSAATAATGSAAPVVVPDPATDPGGFVAVVESAWSHGWGIAVLVVVVGLLELAIYLGEKKITFLAWLGQGRTTIVIGGALAVATVILTALEHGAQWSAALLTGVGALLAYWHQGMDANGKQS